MGALHDGHLSLVARAAERADVVVCSIFVNPTQFDDAADLDRYPRTLDSDLDMLATTACDVVYAPTVADVYPEGHRPKRIDLGALGEVMEGANRPGHFDGVVEVVSRLFDLVQPDMACFGEKDFQQLAVIRQLVAQLGYAVEILPCPIIREPNGLARSSRNELLSSEQRAQAAVIHQTLSRMKDQCDFLNPDEVEQWGRDTLAANDFLVVEYVKVADADSLQPIYRWRESESVRAFVVARFGEVRLIDNMEMTDRAS